METSALKLTKLCPCLWIIGVYFVVSKRIIEIAVRTHAVLGNGTNGTVPIHCRGKVHQARRGVLVSGNDTAPFGSGGRPSHRGVESPTQDDLAVME